MGQTRLRALPFLRIYHDIDKVIDSFAANKERALEFFNVDDRNII